MGPSLEERFQRHLEDASLQFPTEFSVGVSPPRWRPREFPHGVPLLGHPMVENLDPDTLEVSIC